MLLWLPCIDFARRTVSATHRSYLVEDEVEQFLIRQLQDPKHEAHEDFKRKTRQVRAGAVAWASRGAVPSRRAGALCFRAFVMTLRGWPYTTALLGQLIAPAPFLDLSLFALPTAGGAPAHRPASGGSERACELGGPVVLVCSSGVCS